MKGADHIERREATELRVAGRRLEGYAAKFGTEARIGPFTETIAAGAFRDSLGAGGDIIAMVDHDPGRVLARTRSGTLRLSEDATGLAFSIDMPDTSLGRDVLAMAQRGDLGGMSFGFLVNKGGEIWTGDRRELRSVDLREISVIHAFPAYEGTEVIARARMREPKRLRMARLYLETLT
ncbi:peptidase [Iodidimonas nitroreducens]|uniref:Peptidase n=1 Tax=Iodidimonas nitroreducens TaxID=1236968 RepID=A0A5A7NAT8_9PROT|nr:HK97 family phage prohead protease [Iodidimonas nitroreducens]GAK34601.1 phage prohead protease, HK97 family [alpha proteobacterium Q-1]GER05218.1 peptidase [Iodidimonas nitroreducens]